MKNIDLLPQWYKSSRRKQQNLRGQYMVLAGVVVIMNIWNFIGANALSKAGAQVYKNTQKCSEAQKAIDKVEEISSRISNLSGKTKLLEQIDSRINIANVISELSFLIDGKIVLSDVIIEAYKFDKQPQKNRSQAGVRIASSTSKQKNSLPLGNVKFAGILHGIAAETSDVGELVRKLEESEYFQDVSLAFSRSKDIRSNVNNENQKVIEFEISFSLANYRLVTNESRR
jgi:hypothetical protein